MDRAHAAFSDVVLQPVLEVGGSTLEWMLEFPAHPEREKGEEELEEAGGAEDHCFSCL